ncbi:hypothetical protein DGMP_26690 [Desulfomarina profundi]|uniref:Uncharacterized protein n=1 Tax=Desulfomarina profundi TaxID=2772557 RepID=A0A8D5FV87_9BACT|nr:hypothetical protein [Desulfomarina profundi]BCL61976.1 hypothetical protein DGMP_26690 [Desulfomarina profundi]
MSEILVNIKPKDQFIEKRQFQSIKRQVVNNIMESPDEIRFSLMGAIISDLKNNIDSIPFLISKKLKEKQKNVSPEQIRIKTIQLSEKDFKVETNLQDILNYNIEEEHKIVQSALLALGSFNQRLIEMKAYDAVTILDEEDQSLFDKKYQFLS